MSRRRSAAVFAALSPGIAAIVLAAGAETFDFMPRGGRALLEDIAGSSPAELRSIAAERKTAQEWRAFVDSQEKPMTDREKATLAAYLAVNMPIADAAQGVPVLPPDGRDLAWNGCGNCHPLFAGYLTQDRELQGWRNVFLSPFHRELKMTPQEREEFARYSSINMPMKIDDVPPDLRF